MKTATIERYHVYGTNRYDLCVRYNGKTLSWVSTEPSWHVVHAVALDHGADSLRAMVDHARRHGFTHVRYTGDWDKRTKPHGGLIVNQLKAKPCSSITQ